MVTAAAELSGGLADCVFKITGKMFRVGKSQYVDNAVDGLAVAEELSRNQFDPQPLDFFTAVLKRLSCSRWDSLIAFMASRTCNWFVIVAADVDQGCYDVLVTDSEDVG